MESLRSGVYVALEVLEQVALFRYQIQKVFGFLSLIRA